jgi:hypothetical protein
LFTSTHGVPSLRNVPPAPESDLDRYEENRIALHAVEAELGAAVFALRQWYAQHGPDKRVAVVDREVFCRVGALTATPHLSLLESNYRKVLQRRAQLLSEHARLKLAAGLTK